MTTAPFVLDFSTLLTFLRFSIQYLVFGIWYSVFSCQFAPWRPFTVYQSRFGKSTGRKALVPTVISTEGPQSGPQRRNPFE